MERRVKGIRSGVITYEFYCLLLEAMSANAWAIGYFRQLYSFVFVMKLNDIAM